MQVAIMSSSPNPLSSDLIWGVTAIAKEIGRTNRQTFHMLENGYIPARKVGGRWVAFRPELIASLSSNTGK